jgi:hypothetical protein
MVNEKYAGSASQLSLKELNLRNNKGVKYPITQFSIRARPIIRTEAKPR